MGYTIDGVLSQLTFETNLDGVVIKTNLGQWHLVAFFSRKIIFVKTWYKTYNNEFLAIVKAFKTWQHYLKDCKYEILILTDHNNFYRFINIKSLSFRQVHWAQKLSQYHF